MAKNGDSGGGRISPAYVSYRTFLNFIDRLRDSGIPSHVDKTLLGTLSGSTQAQLILALKFLGLLDDGDRPLPAMKALLEAGESEFPEQLREVVLAAYAPFLEGVSLQNTTTGVLQKKLAEAGLSGATVDKAVAFFISAARAAGIDLSPHVKSPRTQTRAPSRRRRSAARARTRGSRPEDDEAPDEDDLAEPEGLKRIPIPIPQLGVEATLVLPEGLTQEIWEWMQPILTAYAKGIIAANERDE